MKRIAVFTFLFFLTARPPVLPARRAVVHDGALKPGPPGDAEVSALPGQAPG